MLLNVFLKFHTEILINFNNGILLVGCFVSYFRDNFTVLPRLVPNWRITVQVW